MKRKSVSVVLATAMLTSVLFGCGDGSNNQKVENSSEQVSQENTESETSDASVAGEAADTTETAANSEDLTGTVVIWDWDGGTQQKYVDKFNEVYPNVTIEVQDVAWDDYMTKLQTSYVSGMDLPDIILGEMAWRGTLYEMGICDDLEEAPYNLDRNNMVASSVPLVSDQNGNILGLEMQVTPAG